MHWNVQYHDMCQQVNKKEIIKENLHIEILLMKKLSKKSAPS